MRSKIFLKLVAMILLLALSVVFFACDEKDNQQEDGPSIDNDVSSSHTLSFAGNSYLKIGLKKNNTYEADATAESFVNGDITYSGAEGDIVGGTWSSGNDGLGVVSPQSFLVDQVLKAVGVTTATNLEDVTSQNIGLWNIEGGKMAVMAGGNNNGAIDTATVEKAVANVNYMHALFGIQPDRNLVINELIVLVDGSLSESAVLGILTAFHVAYRINGSEWIDIDVFGDKHFCDFSSSVEINLNKTQINAYMQSFDVQASPSTNARAVVIDLSDVANDQGDLAQIELVVYIAGADSDCVNAALGPVGVVNIFFNTIAG